MRPSWQTWRDRPGQLSVLRIATLVLLLLPVAKALYDAGDIAHGARPLNDMIHRAGFWALVFLGWTAYGFQPNLFDHPGTFSLTQEAFNVATKDGLAAIYVIGAVAPFHLPSRAPLPKRRATEIVPAPSGHGDSVRS